jgi:hypothetical protein
MATERTEHALVLDLQWRQAPLDLHVLTPSQGFDVVQK